MRAAEAKTIADDSHEKADSIHFLRPHGCPCCGKLKLAGSFTVGRLNRLLVVWLSIVFLAAGPAARAAEQGQLDSDITLFTVLAAINAAGYDYGVDLPSASTTRVAVRNDLKEFKGPSLELLKNFYSQHKIEDSGQDLAQYVSFALQTAGPPDFKFRAPFGEVSPDAQPLHGLARILSDFYREGDVARLFAKYQPDFDREIERYHEPITKAVYEANGYLRIPTSGYLGRRFQIYIDLLGAPGSPSVRGYGADVFVVVHPSRELHTREVRHAYLHYLL